MRLHHVGIATDALDSLVFLFEDIVDARVAHEERFEGMAVTFLDLENGYLELLEPVDDGTIADYLADHGPGIHHLAFETDDVAAALERADDRGVDLVDEEPRRGAWGHDVGFLHPRSTGGVLVEFVEH